MAPERDVLAGGGAGVWFLSFPPRREVELAVLVSRGVGPVGKRRLGEDHEPVAVGDAGGLRGSVRVVDEGACAERGGEDCAQQTAKEATIHSYLPVWRV